MFRLPAPLPTRRTTPLARPALLSAALLLGVATLAPAQAQLLDSVRGAMSGGAASTGSAGAAGGLLGGLGGSAVPALGSVGTGNIAGVIGYCAKNKYLGNDAAGLKDKLLGKLGGEQAAAKDPGYQEGLAGILGGKSDRKLDLSADGIKQQLTDKVCDQVLSYGQSLI